MPKLWDSIHTLKGVGEKKAALYQKLGIATIRDLLYHLPRDYIDFGRTSGLSEAALGEPCAVKAAVLSKSREQRIRKGLSLFKVSADADGDPLELTFFNNRYAVEALKTGQTYLFYGKLSGTLLRREMRAPQVFLPEAVGTLLPVYPSTAGLSSRVIGRDIARALETAEPFPETLPQALLPAHNLLPLDTALRLIHAPRTAGDCQAARRRFVFEELFLFSAAMALIRGKNARNSAHPIPPADLAPFWESLPFSPTAGQREAVLEICADLESGLVMNRLIQGDVGSGKTLVAAAAVCVMARNGYQAAMMAPTEILAEQHAKTLSELLSPFGIRTACLTGSTGVRARREITAALSVGEIGLAVGTHALLSGDIEFRRLGLAITDEQHRFGVAQRAGLTNKSDVAAPVHTLVMSATPIPRTLSLILYGDLDVSTIRELPKGRKPVKTYRIDSGKRERAFGFIRGLLDEGRQAYLVCPLVEETDETKESLASAAAVAKDLAEGAFRGYTVGLLHGKLRPKEKDAVMGAFSRGEIQLLVSTTVVEVGVDVPNAAVMMIENADRFGLSQLHQLRGRIGRGPHESHCILVSDARGETARERLGVICRTSDGFQIAEEDLRLRGPGDFFGSRQHGLPGLENAGLLADTVLLAEAQQAAAKLAAEDPSLSRPENAALARSVRRLMEKVGALPN